MRIITLSGVDRSINSLLRRCQMELTREEKQEIGRRMYNKEISVKDVMKEYAVTSSTAYKWLADYKRMNGIPLGSYKRSSHQSEGIRIKPASGGASKADMDAYMSMSREELINALILAKVNEARAKKGYEVKGDGANKEFVPLSKKNSKS